MSWKKFEAFLIGKVTYPFKERVKHGLMLNFGDTVIIKSQNIEWYYGYSLMDYTSESSLGIFPCNCITVIGVNENLWQNEKKGSDNFLKSFGSRMLTTIVVHISLWIYEIKVFVKENHEEDLIEAFILIHQIIFLFFDIMNSPDNKEKLMRFYHNLWIYINKVNSLFNLDLTIQRKVLSKLTLTNLPVVQLQQLYLENSLELKALSINLDDADHSDISVNPSDLTRTNDMAISVNNLEYFNCSDEIILQWMIVDMYQECQFEHFWLPTQEKGKPKWKDAKFIFKRIPFEIRNEAFYIVVYVYRIGHLLIESNKQLKCKFRRPLAFGSYNLKELQSDNEKITINFYNLTETDFLKPTTDILRMKLPQSTNRLVKVTIKIGNHQVSRSHGLNGSQILENVSLSKDIFNKCDKHCLYIRLHGAEFDRANKKSAKNIEAQLSIRERDREKQECIISNPNTNNKTEYISAVTYHSNSPKWNDLIKIDLHSITPEECYIFIEFYHCTTKDKNHKERRYISCCFLQLSEFFDCGSNEKMYTIKTQKNLSIQEKNLIKEICNLTLILCSTHLSNKKEINEFILSKKEENIQFSNLWKYLKEIQTMTTEDFLKPKLRKDIMEMTKMYFVSSYASHNETITIELFITCQILFDKYIKLGLKEELFSYLRCEFQFIEALLNGIKNVFQNIVKLNISFEILATVMNSMEPIFMILSNYSDPEYHYQISERIKEILKWNVHLFEGNCNSAFNDNIRKLILESTNGNLKHIRNLTSIDVLTQYFESLFKSKYFLNEKILPKEKLDFIEQLLKSEILRDCTDIFLILFHPTISICSQLMNMSSLYILQATDIILQLFMEAKKLLQEERVILFSKRVMHNLFIQIFLMFTTKKCEDIQKNRLHFSGEIENVSDDRNSLPSKTIEYSKESKKMYTLLFAYQEEWCEVSIHDISETDMCTVIVNMKQLLESQIYPKHWFSMFLKISNISARILNKASEYIEKRANEVCTKLIQIFLEACFTFIMQNCLKLENFSYQKRMKIIEEYGDMRIAVMDCFLHVCAFKSSMLNSFEKIFTLQMANNIFSISLLPVVIIRRKIIPFFGHIIAQLLDKCNNKNEILQDFMPKTEIILREGYGDEIYHKLLCDFAQLNKIHEDVSEVVKVLTKLIDLHLENRKLCKHAPKILQYQFLLFAFMKFYKEDVDIPAIFNYYSNKFSLLLESDGYKLEAALVLKLQFDSIPWNEKNFSYDTITCENFTEVNNDLEKVKLGNRIVDLLIETMEYEEAAYICDEFYKHYLSTFNYDELSPILKKMSELYKMIITESRLKMSYYRITFVGGILPNYMKNCKDYIFKCSMWFKVANIIEMLADYFPGSEVQFYQSIPPIESPYEHKMIIYITKMNPIPSDNGLRKNRKINTKIRDFYKDHNICKFSSDHPFHNGQVDKDNEIKTLNITRYIVMTEMMPNIFMWNPIINQQMESLSPIEVATDTILTKNQIFMDTIDEYIENPNKDLRPFSMLLTGTLDAGVNGGMAKYIEAFFDKSNAQEYNIVKINEFIEAFILQKNVLTEALAIHKKLITPQVLQLHERCEECFRFLSETLSDLDVFKTHPFATMPDFENVYTQMGNVAKFTSDLDTVISDKYIPFCPEENRNQSLLVPSSEGTIRHSDEYRSSSRTINFQKNNLELEKSLLDDDEKDDIRRRTSSANEEQIQKLTVKQAINIPIIQKYQINSSHSTPDINLRYDHHSDDFKPVQSPPLPPENQIPQKSPQKAKKNKLFLGLKQFARRKSKELNIVQNLQPNCGKWYVDKKRKLSTAETERFKILNYD